MGATADAIGIPSSRGNGLRVETEAADEKQTEPEGDHVREDNARELLCGHAPARVEPISNGRTRQHREADVVGDGIGEERRHGDAPWRQMSPEVREGEKVVAGQDAVVDGREKNGQASARLRYSTGPPSVRAMSRRAARSAAPPVPPRTRRSRSARAARRARV